MFEFGGEKMGPWSKYVTNTYKIDPLVKWKHSDLGVPFFNL